MDCGSRLSAAPRYRGRRGRAFQFGRVSDFLAMRVRTVFRFAVPLAMDSAAPGELLLLCRMEARVSDSYRSLDSRGLRRRSHHGADSEPASPYWGFVGKYRMQFQPAVCVQVLQLLQHVRSPSRAMAGLGIHDAGSRCHFARGHLLLHLSDPELHIRDLQRNTPA